MKASRSATKQGRQVMAKRSMFVGRDVHKESIDISLAEEGRDGEVRHYGVIPGDLEALGQVVRALRAPTRSLRFVYEAGPCGFGIHRYLTAHGEDWWSSIPRACRNGAATGSRPIGGMGMRWLGCIAPASSRRSTSRHPTMKPCGISCARGKTRSA